MLSAAGDNHSDSNTEHLSLAGLVVFGNRGAVTSLDIVLQSNDYFASDGLTCELTSASDLSYTSGPGGAGTLKLVIGPTDSCVQTSTGNPVTNAGQEMDFDLFIEGQGQDPDAGARFVSTSSDLTDGDGNPIDPPNTVGSLSIH